MAEEAKKKADAPAAPADKAPKKEEAPKAGGGHGEAAAGGGGLLAKTPVLMGGVMLIEAVVLFAGFKFLGGSPKPAAGADIVTAESAGGAEKGGHDGGGGGGEHGGGGGAAPAKTDPKKSVEIQIVGKEGTFRALNKQSNRTFFYDVSIYVVTKAEHEQHLNDVIKERGALIQDRIRTIIAQVDPEKLGGGSEPGLETLRRQVKYQLDLIVGEGIIDEVLVPKCIPFRADY